MQTYLPFDSAFSYADCASQDERWMYRAIQLAKKGFPWTSPNPLVGAVLVKEGRLIAEGYHHAYGHVHAERDCLKNATEDPAGACLYVTLEPCCHEGVQPPCTDAIIAAKISEVFIGSFDPNPLVAGKGIRILQEAGIKVHTHVLKEVADDLNEIFFYYIVNKQPYVLWKYACSLDGKIATYTGDSKWISSDEARFATRGLRHIYKAIMVGIGTVLADDPELTTRQAGCRDPIRIIVDSNLKTPLGSKIVQSASQTPTLIACLESTDERWSPYQDRGVTMLGLPAAAGRVDLLELMKRLAKMQIDSVLLEGGGTLAWSMLSSHLIQKVISIISPKFIGGALAKTPLEGAGYTCISEAISAHIKQVRRVGDDFWIESYPEMPA